MLVAVTGASGFIGRALCAQLRLRDRKVRTVLRSQSMTAMDKALSPEVFAVENIGAETDWAEILSGVDCVIHMAARAHIMRDPEADALTAYRAVNVEGTRHLAERAAASGVKRLIYISSIKVNGERTEQGMPFTRADKPNPEDAYGISKKEAEEALYKVAARTGLELVIIRPPLVYGPGLKGNFLSMLGWLEKGIPLPLGAVQNKRSLVGIENLVDLIITCLESPSAANQTFLVSDDEDISTTGLLQGLGRALGNPARLFPVSGWVLRTGTRLIGKKAIGQRLLGNLQIDISDTKEILGWKPPMRIEEGLQKTAEWYLNRQ